MTPVDPRPRNGAYQVSRGYFRLLVAGTLAIAVASFIRDRGQLLFNISLWLFFISFAVSLWRTQVGLVVATFMLTVTPSLHEQLNVLAGTTMHSWAYPGIDCCLGFLAAWTLKGGLRDADVALDRFPAGSLLIFHAWVTLSAVVAVGRNIWQSASELSLRGLAYNVWLTRGISWHDDYYPLQDPFFYSVALASLLSTWVLLTHGGERLFKGLVGAVLAGASTNVAFALWQKATGLGWVNGQWSINANAFWPDLHSFGVFMASGLFLGYGFLVNRASSLTLKSAIGLATSAAALGLYLSGSRSTVLVVLALLFGCALWAAVGLRGWRRVAPLVACIALVMVIHLSLSYGYRGISYAWLRDSLSSLDAKSLNRMLSYRPEIWEAAIRMYLAFPFFGLGQGAFYRQSAVSAFSESEFLVRMVGEGVHNELLRILVELGPVGLGLVVFIAIPFVRLGKTNLRCVSFYALVGLALGNIYTNALLVRELLMLSAILAGSYFWETQAVVNNRWHPPSARAMRKGAIALTVFTFAALVEVVLSFGRFPFTYGQRCLEVHPLAKDGWTEGVLRVPVPPEAAKAEVAFLADRPDLDRRTLELGLSVLSGGGLSLTSERYTFAKRESDPRHIQLAIPASLDGKRFLELKPSHCYVPLNLGITYDPRRLGVRMTELRFLTATDVETR